MRESRRNPAGRPQLMSPPDPHLPLAVVRCHPNPIPSFPPFPLSPKHRDLFIPSSASLHGHSSGSGAHPRWTPWIQAKIHEIFMLALSSMMTEGKIVSWVKVEGDNLSKGESVVVVESDEADMDIDTFYDGYLATIMVEDGTVAAVGSTIALLVET